MTCNLKIIMFLYEEIVKGEQGGFSVSPLQGRPIETIVDALKPSLLLMDIRGREFHTQCSHRS